MSKNSIFFTQCKELYYCIKEAMEAAAARGAGLGGLSMELGGEFPVEDLNTGEGGLLQVCMEGVGLLFAQSKVSREKSCVKQYICICICCMYHHDTNVLYFFARSSRYNV